MKRHLIFGVRTDNVVKGLGLLLALLFVVPVSAAGLTLTNTNKPARVTRLMFLHHSTGQNWLHDEYGQLGLALRDNNYFVSDSNYGWGPDAIGDTTDIGDWWTWFRGPSSAQYRAAVEAESAQNCDYSRLESTPAGPNEIIMFKSCFPNSALAGNPTDPVPAIADNPLKGQSSGSAEHTIANAKGIYLDLLNYFATATNRLFVLVTAPPLSDETYAANARALNQWLIQNWLADYPHANVWVFDFYNVLTSNGGNPEVGDAGQASGHHHRWWQGTVQHQAAGGANTLAYPSSPSDDHPNVVGSQKATTEFLPLLNAAVNAWREAQTPIVPVPQPGFSSLRIAGNRVEGSVTNLVNGCTYSVQSTTNLNTSPWLDLMSFVGSDTATNWSDALVPQAGGVFYRIKAQP